MSDARTGGLEVEKHITVVRPVAAARIRGRVGHHPQLRSARGQLIAARKSGFNLQSGLPHQPLQSLRANARDITALIRRALSQFYDLREVEGPALRWPDSWYEE